MATEEVGVVELRVRGNEVCLSHPRRSKAMCKGCFRAAVSQICAFRPRNLGYFSNRNPVSRLYAWDILYFLSYKYKKCWYW